jgi:methylthioribose-1-phosphate isomerase
LIRRRVTTLARAWKAIRRLEVRGAPAIGVAAAYAVVLGGRASRARTAPSFRKDVKRAASHLGTSRPTAVNLFWALDRMLGALDLHLAAAPFDRNRAVAFLLQEAQRIHREDCNAGALATGGSGTALAVIYAAVAAGKRVSVVADETRPLLQGARLTAWELRHAGVEVTLICDGAAASVLRSGRIDCVIVGADRIASNGDVANKVGTYGVAVLAREHGVPFFVAAPSTTFDLELRSGAGIPIEERDGDEVVRGLLGPVAPPGVKVHNPAFDVTPARLISAIITEHGVLEPPYPRSIREVLLRGRREPRSPARPSSHRHRTRRTAPAGSVLRER